MRRDNMCGQCTVTSTPLAAGLMALPADGCDPDFFDCNGEREDVVLTVALMNKTGLSHPFVIMPAVIGEGVGVWVAATPQVWRKGWEGGVKCVAEVSFLLLDG